MRSYAITALIGTGLFGLAPQALAASHTRPAHPQPERPGAQNAAHARPADPQPEPARPAVHPQHARQLTQSQTQSQSAGHAQPQQARQQAEAAHAQAQQARPPAHVAVHAKRAEPRPDRPGEQNANVRSGNPQQARPEHPVRILPANPQPMPVRPAYAMHMTGQAAHWEVSPGELQTVRWTLTNTGNRPLEHVQLVASVPAGWSVREGQNCARHGEYLGCDLGGLEPGRASTVLVPMVVQGQPGAVRLAAWSRATSGSLTIPGPTTSFRVVVTGRR